jgi:hypothetical protein
MESPRRHHFNDLRWDRPFIRLSERFPGGGQYDPSSRFRPFRETTGIDSDGRNPGGTVVRTQEATAEALEVVLAGFRLRSDARVVRWPERYMDERAASLGAE